MTKTLDSIINGVKKLAIGVSTIGALTIGSVSDGKAELIIRGTDGVGNRLIYDTDQDITWYDYSRDGFNDGSWERQMDWAAGLSITGGDLIGDYNDWRLPSALNRDGSRTCGGYNCTGSEMGHLYYNETERIDYFVNLDNNFHWSSTRPKDIEDGPWYFFFNNGYQGNGYDSWNDFSAIAVRDGDVSVASVVPEPVSSILFLTGAGILSARRYFNKD